MSQLATHADPAVAGPVLEQAKALPDETIIALIDNDRVEAKLLSKVAARPALSEAISQILIDRGNGAVQRKVIDNPDAAISEKSFAKLVIGINGNKELAAKIAARKDVPEDLQSWLAKVLEQ